MKVRHTRPVGWSRSVVEAIPFDLLVVVVLSLAADVAIFVVDGTAVGLLAALPLLFFFPGYAVVTSLYPEAEAAPLGGDEGLGLSERLALSFGLSVALVPLVGLGLWLVDSYTPVGLATAFTAVVVAGAVVGTVRRRNLPESHRFRLPLERWRTSLATAFGGSLPSLDRLLNVLLAASVVLAVGALGYALVVPTDGETYTNVSLLTENAEGELVAGGYPSEIEAGTGEQLALSIANHEGTSTAYTVVVRIEAVRSTAAGPTVVESEELDRFSVEVEAGESRTVRHRIEPTLTGENLRLSYYVYRGEAPATADAASASQHVYLWLSVVEP